MSAGTCPFGGVPGKPRALNPTSSVPDWGFRVVSGLVWWTQLYWPWRQFLAARAAAIQASAPLLGRPGSSTIYFTDRDSLEGLSTPGEFAYRLGLHSRTHSECQLYGCAVVKFEIPDPALVSFPVPYLGARPGLTGTGAREWCLAANIPLAETMEVIYVEMTTHGPRSFSLPM